jgi:Chaperone of endosialidase
VGNNGGTKRQTKKKELTSMKTVIKTSISGPFLRPYAILTAITLGLLALSPRAGAVIPPPDGGYPGQNTAEGQSALLHLAGGTYNTALGWASLDFNVTGNFNTGVGAATLLTNTGDNNTATGAGALLSNSTGTQNTANGAFALFSNAQGSFNTAAGDQALFSNTSGTVNTAIGAGALENNTTGDHNTAVGGDFVLASNITGARNTAIGVNTLVNNTTGSYNIALGQNAGSGVITASNVIAIGTAGNDVGGSCYIGNIFGATSSNGTAVFVNSNGRLGNATSSRRFKEEIKPMDKASEALLALKPVTFRYKKEIDPHGVPQFGLVAEDVEKVNPDLVVRDKEGKAYSVRYDQVNAMLLNEFLKEHRAFVEEHLKVQQLEENGAAQQKELNLLRSELKEQAAQIQRVSAEVAVKRPPPKTVANNQ